MPTLQCPCFGKRGRMLRKRSGGLLQQEHQLLRPTGRPSPLICTVRLETVARFRGNVCMPETTFSCPFCLASCAFEFCLNYTPPPQHEQSIKLPCLSLWRYVSFLPLAEVSLSAAREQLSSFLFTPHVTVFSPPLASSAATPASASATDRRCWLSVWRTCAPMLRSWPPFASFCLCESIRQRRANTSRSS